MENTPNNSGEELIYPSQKPEDIARGHRITVFNNLVGRAITESGKNSSVISLIKFESSGRKPTWEVIASLTGLSIEKLQDIAAQITDFNLDELNSTNTDEFRKLKQFLEDVGLE